MDVSPGNHKYDMIFGRDIFSKLKIDLCFSDHTIGVNGKEGYKVPMKYVTNRIFNVSSYWITDKIFKNKE